MNCPGIENSGNKEIHKGVLASVELYNHGRVRTVLVKQIRSGRTSSGLGGARRGSEGAKGIIEMMGIHAHFIRNDHHLEFETVRDLGRFEPFFFA